MKKLLALTFGILLIAAACNKPSSQSSNTPNPTPAPQGSVYENEFMKLTVVNGWTAKAVASNQAAVNITKGNYILYVRTNASQASGVEGGRFAEIGMGAPSVDAVVTVQPSEPCGYKESVEAFENYKRVDIFVDGKVNVSVCKVPTNGKKVWYFSYLTDGNGYFIRTWKRPLQSNSDLTSLVVTMSYNSKDVNSFPEKDSTELSAALNEMTSMVSSLTIKTK